MLELQDISVTKNGQQILDNINLCLQPGEKVLLQGDSGSGKTTLIKALLFFEQFSGTILLRDQAMDHTTVEQYRRCIGYVGQSLPVFEGSVADFLRIPYQLSANRYHVLAEGKLNSMLHDLGFTDSVLEKQFADLSSGERQRLLLGQVLLLDKPCYVLDEVTSALDKKNKKKAIKQVMGQKDSTVITVSHDKEWESSCDRILMLENGRLIQKRAAKKKKD